MTSQHIGFPAPDGVQKPDAGILLLERLFLQVRAAQAGPLQLTPLGLLGQPGGVFLFDATRLDHGRHGGTVVYDVNEIERRSAAAAAARAPGVRNDRGSRSATVSLLAPGSRRPDRIHSERLNSVGYAVCNRRRAA